MTTDRHRPRIVLFHEWPAQEGPLLIWEGGHAARMQRRSCRHGAGESLVPDSSNPVSDSRMLACPEHTISTDVQGLRPETEGALFFPRTVSDGLSG